MILDPNNIHARQITGELSKGDLPALTTAQLELGHLPDITRLKPGDLLLTQSAGKPDAVSLAIKAAQKMQFPTHYEWTHAAIYVQPWRVIEATPESNVSTGNIISWMPNTKIMVRRPKALIAMSEHDAHIAGLGMALDAAMLQGQAAYGVRTALDIWWRLSDRVRSIFVRHRETDPKYIICSGLYAKCYELVLRESVLPPDLLRRNEPITPALLANISTLQDVEIGWAKLV